MQGTVKPQNPVKILGIYGSLHCVDTFYTDDEASKQELHPRWADPSDLRHLGLKRYLL